MTPRARQNLYWKMVRRVARLAGIKPKEVHNLFKGLKNGFKSTAGRDEDFWKGYFMACQKTAIEAFGLEASAYDEDFQEFSKQGNEYLSNR